jgi:putative oxidoreductase
VSTHGDHGTGDDLFRAPTSYGDSATVGLPLGNPLDQLGDGFDHERPPARWHGGADFGLLVLRIAVGGIFIAHGLQHVFGLLHGSGIAGFARFIDAAGFSDSTVLAWVAGITELGGGVLVVLGLFSQLGAAGLLGLMANVVAMKWPLGFFAPGYEYELLLGVCAFALLFTGPGRAALERHAAWYRHPVLTGFVFLIVSAVATAASMYLFK